MSFICVVYSCLCECMYTHRHEYTTQLLIAQIHTEHPLCVLPILGLGLFW